MITKLFFLLLTLLLFSFSSTTFADKKTQPPTGPSLSDSTSKKGNISEKNGNSKKNGNPEKDSISEKGSKYEKSSSSENTKHKPEKNDKEQVTKSSPDEPLTATPQLVQTSVDKDDNEKNNNVKIVANGSKSHNSKNNTRQANQTNKENANTHLETETTKKSNDNKNNEGAENRSANNNPLSLEKQKNNDSGNPRNNDSENRNDDSNLKGNSGKEKDNEKPENDLNGKKNDVVKSKPDHTNLEEKTSDQSSHTQNASQKSKSSNKSENALSSDKSENAQNSDKENNSNNIHKKNSIAHANSSLNQILRVTAELHPKTDHINLQASTIIIALVDGSFYFLNRWGEFIAWDLSIYSLEYFEENIILPELHYIEVYSEVFEDYVSDMQIFIAYRLVNEDVIYYTSEPALFTVVREE